MSIDFDAAKVGNKLKYEKINRKYSSLFLFSLPHISIIAPSQIYDKHILNITQI